MRIPKLCHNKQRDTAFVRIDGKRYTLGKWNTPEASEQYRRILAKLESSSLCAVKEPTAPTVAELVAEFFNARRDYYVKGGKQTGQLARFKTAVAFPLELYSTLPASEFGAAKLAICRDAMVRSGRFSRTYVNSLVNCVRTIFRFAVERELVSPTVLTSLQALTPLMRGRCQARETTPVAPVDQDVVDATLPFLSSVVADMVRVERLTGMRPGEICAMRAGDLQYVHSDNQRTMLIYTLRTDKNDWRRKVGDNRRVVIGPKAAAILASYMLAREGDADAYIFQPAEAVAEQSAIRRMNRKTPLTPSQRARRATREYKECYTVSGYARAIARAAQHAGVQRWSPNQLRHLCATQIRARYGIEAAQTVLGHAKADTTQIYAERDFRKAFEIASQEG